jgi:hypothetical protein
MPLERNLSTPESRRYWEFVEETAREVQSDYLYHICCPKNGVCSLGDGQQKCRQVVQEAMAIVREDDRLIEAWERMTFGGVVVEQVRLSGIELDQRMRAILTAATPETSLSSAMALVNLGFGGMASFSLVMQVLDMKKRMKHEQPTT